MTINFLKKIKEGNVDEITHYKFVRFGPGEFNREEFTVKRGKNVELKAGFDFADVFMRFLAEHAKSDIEVNGTIVSNNKSLEGKLNELGLEVVAQRGKKYTVKGTLSGEQLKNLLDELLGSIVLLNASSGDLSLKTKTSAPKPGSLKERFCKLKVPATMWDTVKDEFLFFVDKDGKQYSVKYSFHIDTVLVDDALLKSDPARARKEAKRKGVIKLEVSVNKEPADTVELAFEA